MKNTILFLILLIAVSACTATPSATPTPEPSPTAELPTKICLVTDIGSINDGTFNQYAYEGMINLQEDYPQVITSYKESGEEAAFATNVASCIEEGADIVITVGFLITQATAAAAAEHPEVYFIGVDQDVNSVENPPANYTGTQAREDQVGYLVGIIAANVANEMGGEAVAGVYGIDVPAVKRFRNGYEQGVLHVNPDWVIGENILGSYTDSFLEPETGAALATDYIEQGAVVIFGAGGPTGSGAILAAAEAGVFVIGVDKDEYFTTFTGGDTAGSEFLITSAIKRVDSAVYELARVLIEGNFSAFPGGSNYIMDVANNGVGVAPVHEAQISEAIFAEAEAAFQEMVAGTLETGVNIVTGDLLATEEASAEATAEATEE